ncbi:MAG: flavodoxin family protein [Pelosinus sp.]|nr:flavodoxin family protein [Pelosinus sp.]
MKFIGLVGSPRKGGNTDVLVQKVLEGAQKEGADTEVFYLNELNVRGCQACFHCKKTGTCAVNDDLTKVFQAINEADGIVVGSPIYFGRFTAQVAPFFDRLFAYIKPDSTTSLKSGKKFSLVFTQGQSDTALYENTINSVAAVLTRIGFVPGPKAIVGAGLRDIGAVNEQEQYLTEAFSRGQELAAR